MIERLIACNIPIRLSKLRFFGAFFAFFNQSNTHKYSEQPIDRFSDCSISSSCCTSRRSRDGREKRGLFCAVIGAGAVVQRNEGKGANPAVLGRPIQSIQLDVVAFDKLRERGGVGLRGREREETHTDTHRHTQTDRHTQT